MYTMLRIWLVAPQLPRIGRAKPAPILTVRARTKPRWAILWCTLLAQFVLAQYAPFVVASRQQGYRPVGNPLQKQ